MTNEPNPLESRIGHRFNDPSLLRQALSHTSLGGETTANNQRLEFLGDAVLGLVIAEALYRGHPEAAEGALDRMRALCVSGRTLARKGRELGLHEALQVSEAERLNNPERSDAMIEDCFEALVGALYLDGGHAAASAFILKTLERELKSASADLDAANPKGQLQEHFQSTGSGQIPTYEVTSESGPDHARSYTVEVRAGGRTLGRGTASSKKAAEAIAAEAALQAIGERPGPAA